MDRTVALQEIGGIDKLQVTTRAAARPGPHQIRIRQEAIGINFIDIYHRIGLYPLPAMPAVLGVEAAGVVEEIGSGVTGLAVGDRVAYAGTVGAYASARVLAADRALRLPEGIETRLAAAAMIKGMTAHMLLHRVHAVQPGDILLVHAAAGALGTLLTRWGKHLGATVIGTAGSDAKAEAARASGADHVIVGRDADIVSEVAKLTDGLGAHAAYDGIGGAMLAKTIECVRPFGMVASIGQAAGPIPPIAVERLGPRRSLALARPSIMAYVADQERYVDAARSLFDAMRAGIVPAMGKTYRLEDAAQAQADLEGGRTTGSLLLIP